MPAGCVLCLLSRWQRGTLDGQAVDVAPEEVAVGLVGRLGAELSQVEILVSDPDPSGPGGGMKPHLRQIAVTSPTHGSAFR
jgi:hypothetical protein